MVHDQPILLVENNEREANLLRLLLESDGYRVDTAYSGWAAVEKIKVKKFGLAVLDFALPDMKGDELVEMIKSEDPKMGVILLTGFKSAIDPSRLKKFDYVLEKPVDPKKIFEAVKFIENSTR